MKKDPWVLYSRKVKLRQESKKKSSKKGIGRSDAQLPQWMSKETAAASLVASQLTFFPSFFFKKFIDIY